MPHDTTRLANLGNERAKLTAKLETNRPQLHAEVLAAHDGGIGTVEIARLAGITRDAVRQIINKRDKTAADG